MKYFALSIVTIITFISIGAMSLHPPATNAANFSKSTYTTGLSEPTAMQWSPDGRLFVSEKTGSLRVIKNGQLLQTPFLQVSVASNSERGLLGIAFDPDFSNNRYVYVYYTRSQTPIKNRVSRFTASATNPDVVQANSEVVILDNIASDAGNHNGGAINFGPDGKLYIATGDGGQTSSNSQNLGNLSGKILRINKDGTIPADNPFVNQVGARGEIWAYGLRNPFTFAFDGTTSKMHINDVGQSTWEEINVGTKGGNYGWPTCEGRCNNSSFINPIYQYGRAEGRAITGGVFYKGEYYFGDYLGEWIRSLNSNNTATAVLTNAGSPVDLKLGPDGQIYYLSISDGNVYKLTDTSSGDKPGDADNDGDVDGVDYTRWLNNYNTQKSGPANGDFNNNGVVDGVDYTVWLNNYGK